ncbi:peroxide stress protein YaaA [Aquitalea sp. S1-19]|nr:peroxide stress protein YaaA [Aquitalea sp. S1-19]
MLMLISPAKTLDNTPPSEGIPCTQPELLAHSAALMPTLRELSPQQLSQLMKISDTLAILNAGRFDSWQPPFTSSNAKQAVLTFMGDVYEGLGAQQMNQDELLWLQDRLRILSGLYGVLRPLDLMQPYRLEMGTRLANARGNNLYAFWGDIITDTINRRLAQDTDPVLINLASEEYFKSVKRQTINAAIITPVFQDRKNGQYKIISFYAKRARGLMVRWALKHKIEQAQDLRRFDSEGYAFDADASSELEWVFRRDSAGAL